MGAGGTFLRLGGVAWRFLQLCTSAVVLGIFSYFLATLSENKVGIAARWKAVEGISGAAVLYTIIAVFLVCCLGGVAFFGAVTILLDILFIGGFIVIAWYTRHGANSCKGQVQTPLGEGDANYNPRGFPSLHTACRLNTAAFAVSLIGIFLFAVTAIWTVMMVRHHRKEKKYGPGPNNNYTSGSGRRAFWKRKSPRTTRDAEAATALNGNRVSHETGYTNTASGYSPEPKYGEPGYGQTGTNYYTNQHNAGHF